MKSLLRQVDRNNEEETASNEELKRKGREQAIETALAIESEVTKWQNGIAELEAMLAAAESEDENEDYSEHEEEGSAPGDDRPIPVVRFPSLPPVVVPDEDDKDEVTLARSGSQTDLSDTPEVDRISS